MYPSKPYDYSVTSVVPATDLKLVIRCGYPTLSPQKSSREAMMRAVFADVSESRSLLQHARMAARSLCCMAVP